MAQTQETEQLDAGLLKAEESGLDRSMSRALGHFGQLTSRRGVLAALGKITLSLVGAGIAWEVLPVNRTVAEATSCSDWQLCGLTGYTCDCCNSGNGLGSCPPNGWFCSGFVGSYWASCCCDTGPVVCHYVAYHDCCDCCVSCGCTWCFNHGSTPTWCQRPDGTQGNYCCTAVTVWSTTC